jgi:hypothetical protein
MGRLGDFARKAMNWQKDQALADAINEDTEKKKQRIRETRAKIAKMTNPPPPIPYGDSVSPTRRAAKRDRSLSEEELNRMGFGKQEGTTD